MEYKIAEIVNSIDVTNNFHDLTNEDLVLYKDWFFENRAKRMAGISELIFNHETKLSKENILDVEKFLLANITIEPKDENQIKYEESLIPPIYKSIVKVDEFELTKSSKSLCLDIGILFGEWLIDLDPGVKWKIENDKRMVYFGNAVLFKKTVKVEDCPMIIVRNFALKTVEKTFENGMLLKLFKLWLKDYNVDFKLE